MINKHNLVLVPFKAQSENQHGLTLGQKSAELYNTEESLGKLPQEAVVRVSTAGSVPEPLAGTFMGP